MAKKADDDRDKKKLEDAAWKKEFLKEKELERRVRAIHRRHDLRDLKDSHYFKERQERRD